MRKDPAGGLSSLLVLHVGLVYKNKQIVAFVPKRSDITAVTVNISLHHPCKITVDTNDLCVTLY